MALASRCKAPAAVGAARSRRSVRVCCQKGSLERVQVAAASVVAASIIASPAFAGVTLEQPQLKKVFQDDGAPAAPVKREYKGLQGFSLPSVSAPSSKADAPKAEAPKPKPAVSEQGNDLDPRSIALPGALALTVGGFFAASKLDGGLNEWFINAMVKDSNAIAAGYEPSIKAVVGGAAVRPSTGTKKVKASSTKKGGFFGKK